ncbi:MAG: hypothetical protein HY735_22745 [Verrucomicrobia bacterium]|nr:hypothetical protein [Verrucomicrobiota bacterium]
MPRARVSDTVTLIVFAVLGFLFSLVFLYWGGVEWVFHTTKPFHFLDDSLLFAFILLFTASGCSVAMVGQRFASGARYGARFAVVAGVWVGTVLLASVAVRIVAEAVHRSTQSIPEGLLPVGLLLIPALAAVSVLLVGFRRARGYDPSG